MRHVALVLALAACSSRDTTCPTARRDAAIAVTLAEQTATYQLDKALARIDEARDAYEDIKSGVAKLENKLRLVEQSMGCFTGHCCEQLASFTAADKADVYEAAMGVWQVSLPVEVETVVTPLKETLNAVDHLEDMTARESTRWCSAVREAIKTSRQLTPSAWTRAMFQASKDVDLANEAAAIEKRRALQIGTWAHTVRIKGHAPTPTLENNGYIDAHVMSASFAVDEYVEACVGQRVASK